MKTHLDNGTAAPHNASVPAPCPFPKQPELHPPNLSCSLNAAGQVILSFDGRREASEGGVGGKAQGEQGVDRTSRGRPTARFKVSDQREPSPRRACRRKGRRWGPEEGKASAALYRSSPTTSDIRRIWPSAGSSSASLQFSTVPSLTHHPPPLSSSLKDPGHSQHRAGITWHACWVYLRSCAFSPPSRALFSVLSRSNSAQTSPTPFLNPPTPLLFMMRPQIQLLPSFFSVYDLAGRG